MSPSPIPTAPPVDWGDFSCDNIVDGKDALSILSYLAETDGANDPQGADCPPIGLIVDNDGNPMTWGDADCTGDITILDVLKVLANISSLGGGMCPALAAREPSGFNVNFAPMW
jgi:hypothetical protein